MRSERATTGVASQSDGRDNSLFSVRDLERYYPTNGDLFSRSTSYVKTVDGVSFDVCSDETFTIVGESGCGRTTLGETIARLYKSTGESINFDSREITDLDGRALRALRRDIQVIYQDPSSSLNPRRHIGDIVKEPLVIHDVGTSTDRDECVADLPERVDLPVGLRHRYPNALSGGQQQCVTIVRALAVRPKSVVLDKPTSALDVSVQVKIISLLDKLQEELGLTYLMISHDLSLVRSAIDRIGVMYLGNFMEVVNNYRLSESSRNPYTEQPLSTIPVVESHEQDLRPDAAEASSGTPDLANSSSDCSFSPRCHHASDTCNAVNPKLVEVKPGHLTRCLYDSGSKQDDVDAYLARDQADREGVSGDRD